jgi:hypothetical protein
MRWILIAGLVVVGTGVVVTLIGMLLPRGHSVSRSASLHHSPEAVWKLIAGAPTWRHDVRSYEELPGVQGRRTWRETDRHGQKITFEVVDSLPPRHLVVRIAGPKLPFGGVWMYDIMPTAQGCSLTITENGEVYNPIFRFVSRFIMGHTATLDAYLKSLTTALGENSLVTNTAAR